jgi:cytochrome P450
MFDEMELSFDERENE